MTRLRALVFLLPLIMLSPSTHPLETAAASPASPFKPGNYAGPITITAYEAFTLDPNPAMDYSYSIAVKMVMGTLEAYASRYGGITLKLGMTIPFTFKGNALAKDDGSGCCCLGYTTSGSGRGFIRMLNSAPALTPVGKEFMSGSFRFSLLRTSQLVRWAPVSKCPQDDGPAKASIRRGMDEHFQAMFQNRMKFEVLDTGAGYVTGKCSLPLWEASTIRVLGCTWTLYRKPATR